MLLSPEIVASCSNDRTIRLWDARSEGLQRYTMLQHTDYVMALAAAPRQGLLASAGLSSEVFVWDIPTGLQLLKQASLLELPGKRRGVGCNNLFTQTPPARQSPTCQKLENSAVK